MEAETTFRNLIQTNLYQMVESFDDVNFRDTWVDTTVEILKHHPSLASEHYNLMGSWALSVGKNGMYKTDLLFLLAYFGATRDKIEIVYNLYPEAVIWWESGELALIIKGFGLADVVSFLLEKNPDLLFQETEDNTGYSAVHMALLKYRDLECHGPKSQQQEFLDLAHTWIPLESRNCDEKILKCALFARCPDQTVELILEHQREPMKSFDAKGPNPIAVSARDVKWLTRLLPHLESFSSLSKNGFESPIAFESLMDSIATDSNRLKYLYLGLPCSWLYHKGPTVNSLQRMLSTCGGHPKIHLLFQRYGDAPAPKEQQQDHTAIIGAIRNGLSIREEPLQYLKLEGLTIPRSSSPVALIPSSVKRLELDSCHLECSALATPSTNSFLEKLYMIDFKSNPELIKSLMHQMAPLRSIKYIKLRPQFNTIPVADVTKQVVELICHARNLEELVLIGNKLQVDLSCTADVIQHSTSLKALRVTPKKLESNNGKQKPIEASREKIKYYTTLNSNGRRAAGDPQTPKSSLVELLYNVPGREKERTSLQYGLLHENPCIWAG